MRAKWLRSTWYLAASLVFAAIFSGCASTGSSAGYGPPPIEEGKGRLMLETGGINGVNFYVIDNETGDEVYSDSPRAAASSPIGYESSYGSFPQYVDLPPGSYLVVVNTDVEDSVEKEVEIYMGQEAYVTIPIGRFQLIFFEGSDRRPFHAEVRQPINPLLKPTDRVSELPLVPDAGGQQFTAGVGDHFADGVGHLLWVS